MLKVFEMTNLGLISYFLGIEVTQDYDRVFISQKKYAKEILKKLHMAKVSARQCIRRRNLTKMMEQKKLMKTNIEAGLVAWCLLQPPNIMFTVSLLSRFMYCASEVHFQAAKRIVRYIKGTTDYGIKYSYCQNFKLHGFSDSDWVGSVDDMRSTTSVCFSFESRIFLWSSKKQDVIAQSTSEVEYVAANATVNQGIWIRKILADLHMEQNEQTQIHVANL